MHGRVLHLVPDSLYKLRWLGTSKDIRGRTEYFRERGIPFDELVVPDRSDKWLAEKLASSDLQPYRAVLFELPVYPTSLRILRSVAPTLQILVRPINAEFFHQWHIFAAHFWRKRPGRWWPRWLRYAVTRLSWDVRFARQSSAILSITEWETRRYWSWFVPGALTVPYFQPLSEYPLAPPAAKERLCVSFGSVQQSAFTADAEDNFARVTAAAPAGWECASIGEYPPNRRRPPSLNVLGVVEDPYPLLARARAVAVLTDYGFGFKTKILDAICHGCHVLVKPGLYARLPEEVRPWCHRVDPGRPDSFTAALKQCEAPPPPTDPNRLLRGRAFAALDEALTRSGVLRPRPGLCNVEP